MAWTSYPDGGSGRIEEWTQARELSQSGFPQRQALKKGSRVSSLFVVVVWWGCNPGKTTGRVRSCVRGGKQLIQDMLSIKASPVDWSLILQMGRG